jgi:hypothetical protein
VVYCLVVLALFAMILAGCGDDETTVAPPPASSGATIFGDGSAGARTISSDTLLAEPNLQFTNFTVSAGVTLTVESGTVIRCSRTFTNEGTIVVLTSAQGSEQTASTAGYDGSYAPAEAGVALRAPSPGEIGDDSSARRGGEGGVRVSEYQARMLLRPGPKAGSGAGGSYGYPGMTGGGSLVVLAKTAIVNDGSITADGQDAPIRSGGGGGGIVVLASAGSVTNNGTISATGGNGGTNDSFAGRGGGGGGGIVHFLAPSVTEGTTDVAAGTGGAASGNVTLLPRQGGGGGGACGGSGGNGGDVSASDVPSAAGSGGAGYTITTIANPSSLFLARGIR